MSLRDQLLKSGLVSKKQVKDVEIQKKKLDHSALKNDALSKSLSEMQKKELAELEEQKQLQILRDKELNRRRDELILSREKMFRAYQMVKSQSIKLPRRSNIPYYFKDKDSTTIKRMFVSPWHQILLAQGKLGIVQSNLSNGEFFIVPKSTIETLKELEPSSVVVLYDEVDDTITDFD